MKKPLSYFEWESALEGELWLDIVLDEKLGKDLYEEYLIRFQRHEKILEILKTKSPKDI